jgi:regulator of sigma E protease
VTGKVSAKSMDGPIGIARVAGQSYQAGLAPLLMLMAMISLNLGVMNLLPIPILDGGVMLMLIVEGVMGRDLSLAMKERIVQFGFVFLVVLTAFVLYNDVLKLLPASVTGQ